MPDLTPGKEFDPDHPLQRQIDYIADKKAQAKRNAFLPITCPSCMGTFAVDHQGAVARAAQSPHHNAAYWCCYCGHKIVLRPMHVSDLRGVSR